MSNKYIFFEKNVSEILLRTNTKTKQAQGESDWNTSSTSSGRVFIHTSVFADKTAFLAKL